MNEKKGFSFLEVIFAVGILAACLVPIITLFGNSGRAVQKSQNLSVAVSLVHKISQHLKGFPYNDIIDVVDCPIADGPTDYIFNPLFNYGNSSTSEVFVTSSSAKELYKFFKTYSFKYSLEVSTFSTYKSVLISVKWVESSLNLVYQREFYICDR
ncbi:MAG: hypothetical protein HQM10_07110 [Candidatus Riflebacteria bacterium]|nr:hypothetical protein [Candidatus Riflebacteria bacterium]